MHLDIKRAFFVLVQTSLRDHSYIKYSKVPNKRSATFINFRDFFQGLRSYLEGVRLFILTKYFSKENNFRKVGTRTPNIMTIMLFR